MLLAARCALSGARCANGWALGSQCYPQGAHGAFFSVAHALMLCSEHTLMLLLFQTCTYAVLVLEHALKHLFLCEHALKLLFWARALMLLFFGHALMI